MGILWGPALASWVCSRKEGKALPATHLCYLILARQIESKKEMSRNAQIAETQMPAKRKKKGALEKMHEVLNRSLLLSEPVPLGSLYMATRDSIVSATAVVGVRTPSLCSFYLSLSLSLSLFIYLFPTRCSKPPCTATS
jgi:hypothetical protein